jgi:hypothetical protein
MPLNTFRDVLLAQLEQADIAHLAINGPRGLEVEIDTPTGPRIVVMFDREGDLLSVEIEGEES